MTTSPTWQAILQRIMKIPGERQRLSIALGVTTMTLIRWANGDSRPQRSHLVQLTRVIQPQYYAELLEALEREYPEMHLKLKDESVDEVSPEFFAQVLNARATIIESLRFWYISEMVLKQALAQLDSNQLGMAITFAQCMPPSYDSKIRSLRERIGRGTSPWMTNLEHLALFLGLESLAGYVVQTRRLASVEDLREKNQFLPAYYTEFEVSSAAQPIWWEGRIAGCLLASSTEPGYFSQQRLALLGVFSNVMALALEPSEFYPSDLIELRVLPNSAQQRPYLAAFQQRVRQTIVEAAQRQQPINNAMAERKVWQEIERELLALAV